MQKSVTTYLNRDFASDIEVDVVCETWYDRGEKIETKILGKGWYCAYLFHTCKEFPSLELTDEEKACAEHEIAQLILGN